MAGRIRCVTLLVVSLAMCGFLGCGKSGTKTFPVSGMVTVDGQPLAEGLICFRTIQTGVLETIDVKNGRFQGNVWNGERRVEVYAFRVTTLNNVSGMKADIKQNLIPARYNTDSTLTAKVTDEGPNEFEFALKSK